MDNVKVRSISIKEMESNIFKFMDFPEVVGISSKWLLHKTNFYGLFLNNSLIGIARLCNKNEIAKLKLIEIKKDYQNQGYGSYFLAKLENIAKNIKKCNRIRLCPRDYRVYDFYKQNKYEFIHEHLMLKEI